MIVSIDRACWNYNASIRTWDCNRRWNVYCPEMRLSGNVHCPEKRLPGNVHYPEKILSGNVHCPEMRLPGNVHCPDMRLSGNVHCPEKSLSGNVHCPEKRLPGNVHYPEMMTAIGNVHFIVQRWDCNCRVMTTINSDVMRWRQLEQVQQQQHSSRNRDKSFQFKTFRYTCYIMTQSYNKQHSGSINLSQTRLLRGWNPWVPHNVTLPFW